MKILDCRGLACPQPVMHTRDALEQGRPQELLVLVDNACLLYTSDAADDGIPV